MPKVGEGEEGFEVVLHLELQDGSVHTIFPSLYAELCCFVSFRGRNAATLQSLRHRALEWAKTSGLRWFDVQQGFHSSVALAFDVSQQETVAGRYVKSVGERNVSSPLA
jgi:hypothetical protein